MFILKQQIPEMAAPLVRVSTSRLLCGQAKAMMSLEAHPCLLLVAPSIKPVLPTAAMQAKQAEQGLE
jgi:hypothetical protein